MFESGPEKPPHDQPSARRGNEIFEQEAQQLETAAAYIYSQYFGQEWRSALKQNVLAEVRAASIQERRQKGNNPGWIATNAVVIDSEDPREQILVRNEIVIYQNPTDFALRHEVGEALWNILENIAITQALPGDRDTTPTGLRALAENHQATEAIAQFCRSLLDYWNAAYAERPDRYVGMGADPIREYDNIPEWKSEGFADAIAVAIKAKAGRQLTADELLIVQQLSIEAGKLIDLCIDQFITGIQIAS